MFEFIIVWWFAAAAVGYMAGDREPTCEELREQGFWLRDPCEEDSGAL